VKAGKRKRTKDPNAPKRALSAFFWFCNDERPKVRETNPKYTVGDVAKELGRRWNECTEDQKSKFEALAAKDKARYEKELKAYKAGKPPVGKAKAPPKKKESSEEEDDDEEEDDSDDDWARTDHRKKPRDLFSFAFNVRPEIYRAALI